jgi:hypothetical protein
MKYIKKYFLLIIVFIFLFFNLFLMWQVKIKNDQINKNILILNEKKQEDASNYIFRPVTVDNCRFENDAKIASWKVYVNKAGCFRMQYPTDWNYMEYNEMTEAYSLEAVGFNNEALDYFSKDKNKIVINSYINYPIGLVVDVALLKDPKIDHFRSLEDYRIKGNYRDSGQRDWVYVDTAYLQNYITNQVMTISYYEKEYSEKNRKIFNDMLETLEFGQ